jgi:uncharacterized protein with FMN-binding domain
MPESGKKVANSLVAMSSAAILAVYSAGYTRTRAAARRLEEQAAARLPAAIEAVRPVVATAVPTVASAPKVAHAKAVVPIKATAPIDLPEPPPVTAPTTSSATAPTTPPAAVPTVAESQPVSAEAAPVPPPPPPAPKWKDGTYYGWGSSRHGDIQAAVTIESGRIASATIAQCLTRYSCDVISKLPPEVPQRQSAEVDYVSGATQSANAFYYAVMDALSKAK